MLYTSLTSTAIQMIKSLDGNDFRLYRDKIHFVCESDW